MKADRVAISNMTPGELAKHMVDLQNAHEYDELKAVVEAVKGLGRERGLMRDLVYITHLLSRDT